MRSDSGSGAAARGGAEAGAGRRIGDAARRRAAVETFSRHEAALRRTAGRYSLCAADAEDALQRALEILLTKAPTTDPRELIRWTQTVVKHEALAVRRERERILAGPAATPAGEGGEDWVALIPAAGDGPAERAVRSEAVARGREALQALKPQELRALTLLAEGYSYAEIGAITGFSRTKVNRCLAEGRERFRRVVAGTDDGSRCAEMQPLLSRFCDREASAEEERAVREHLRACGRCRAVLRAYRAAPAAAAALAPPLPRSPWERAHEWLVDLWSRLGGGAADPGLGQTVAGGTRGAGAAALAKLAALCAGTVGGAAACVAGGVVPGLPAAERPAAERPAAERPAADPPTEPRGAAGGEAPPTEPRPEPAPEPEPSPAPEPEPEPVQAQPPPSAAGAVEYVPPPPPPTPAPSGGGGGGAGSPAGEFGP